MSKTVKQMVDELRACDYQFVTYGYGDIGLPIDREEAIEDILTMDDDMIGEGLWFPCDKQGNIIYNSYVSINNGGTYMTADEIDEELLLKYWEELSEAMEETLCEQLHGNSGVETEREFLRKYLELSENNLIVG